LLHVSVVFSGSHVLLHSFPTRRSSDLLRIPIHFFLVQRRFRAAQSSVNSFCVRYPINGASQPYNSLRFRHGIKDLKINNGVKLRSEEHTSELHSRENLVCRLLLEKKNL